MIWMCPKEAPPPPDTAVLAWLHGDDFPRILERRWERCSPHEEPYFKDFLYWADVYDEIYDLDDRVVAWQWLPPQPTMENL